MFGFDNWFKSLPNLILMKQLFNYKIQFSGLPTNFDAVKTNILNYIISLFDDTLIKLF